MLLLSSNAMDVVPSQDRLRCGAVERMWWRCGGRPHAVLRLCSKHMWQQPTVCRPLAQPKRTGGLPPPPLHTFAGPVPRSWRVTGGILDLLLLLGPTPLAGEAACCCCCCCCCCCTRAGGPAAPGPAAASLSAARCLGAAAPLRPQLPSLALAPGPACSAGPADGGGGAASHDALLVAWLAPVQVRACRCVEWGPAVAATAP